MSRRDELLAQIEKEIREACSEYVDVPLDLERLREAVEDVLREHLYPRPDFVPLFRGGIEDLELGVFAPNDVAAAIEAGWRR